MQDRLLVGRLVVQVRGRSLSTTGPLRTLRVGGLLLTRGAALVLVACGPGMEAGTVAGCSPEVTVPKIFGGHDKEQELALDEQQTRAIGRLEPDLVDREERRLLACTATLVAPSWAVSAAHCVRRREEGLWFVMDANTSGQRDRRVVARFEDAKDDVLLLELEPPEDETPDPFIAIATDASALRVGDVAELAGYGVREDGEQGELRYVVEPVTAVDDAYFTVDGRGRTGACSGDSGGPLLGHGEDGSARVFGVLSSGSSDCRGLDYYAKLRASDPRWALLPPEERCPAH